MGMTDPARFHDVRTNSKKDVEYRIALEKYFTQSIGSNVEKLQNFAKYVPTQYLRKFFSKYEIFKKILTIQGSIVECGVLFGGGLMTWAQLSAIFEPLNHQRKVIGFDTFCGYPSLSDEDRGGTSEFLKKGAYAVDSCEDLVECIRLFDMNRFLNHIPKLELVKGDARETIPQYIKENQHTVVSLLYLDFGLFEPSAVALRHFVPRIPKGGIIAFDELNAGNFPGETLAVIQELGINKFRIERFPFDTYTSYAVVE